MTKKNKLDNLIPFKPGESGNPNGRPKGSISMKQKIEKILSMEVDDINPITQESERMTVGEALILRQVLKARKGDTRAFEVLKDHIEAKPKQEIDINQEIHWNEEKSYVKPKDEE